MPTLARRRTAPATDTAESTHRWVTCRQEDGWASAQHKHLLNLRFGDQGNTACGASGMGEGVWFSNQFKPECPTCVTAAAENPQVVIRPYGRRQ